jgi:hypothetical protein
VILDPALAHSNKLHLFRDFDYEISRIEPWITRFDFDSNVHIIKPGHLEMGIILPKLYRVE